jgi:hypothetical protein
LGFVDVCGLDIFQSDATGLIAELAKSLPNDGYGRGNVAPDLPTTPDLFFRATTEDICEQIAPLVIDTPARSQIPGVKQWSGNQPDAAVQDFATILMGFVPNDLRYAQAVALLKQHYASALGQTGPTGKAVVNASQALQSTFVLACTAPSAVSLGL